MHRFALALLVLAISPAFAEMACYNRLAIGPSPLKIDLAIPADHPATVVATFRDARCRLKQIKYNPVSPKYEGWIRVGTPRGDCQELGLAMFGRSSISKKPIRIYWLSLSREVQDGHPGRLQVGYENDINPEKGPEAKMFMDCES